MPERPPSTMRKPDKPKRPQRAPRQDYRQSAAKRGYDHNWRPLRYAHITVNRLCVHCLARGIETLAQEVDHIIPHRGDAGLRMDPGNLQSLCKSCHSRKTGRGQ